MEPSQSTRLRALIAYAIIGFINTLLPQIIFASSYLIIPYPRAVVVCIQVLPAWIVKLTFPHVITRLPYKLWPLVFASCWVLSIFVTEICPPNVTSLLRILMTLLAAATAAGTDVFCLGRMPFYESTALAGWGIGTASGLLICSVSPYVWTRYYGHAIRDALPHSYYLVAVLLVALYIIMPSPREVGGSYKDDSYDKRDAEVSLLAQEPTKHNMTLFKQIRYNLAIVRAIKVPYATLLRALVASQYLIIPGICRAYVIITGHGSYEAFYATSGLVFHLGNLLGRSTTCVSQLKGVDRFRPYTNIILPLSCLVFICGIASNAVIFYPLLFAGGFVSGLIYINIWAGARDYLIKERKPDAQFGLAALSAFEVSGMLAGALAGCVIEWQLCDGSSIFGPRWCTNPNL